MFTPPTPSTPPRIPHALFITGVQAVKVLLRAEPWVLNADMGEGRRPLLCAVDAEALDIVQVLLKQPDLDPNLADIRGSSAHTRCCT